MQIKLLALLAILFLSANALTVNHLKGGKNSNQNDDIDGENWEDEEGDFADNL